MYYIYITALPLFLLSSTILPLKRKTSVSLLLLYTYTQIRIYALYISIYNIYINIILLSPFCIACVCKFFGLAVWYSIVKRRIHTWGRPILPLSAVINCSSGEGLWDFPRPPCDVSWCCHCSSLGRQPCCWYFMGVASHYRNNLTGEFLTFWLLQSSYPLFNAVPWALGGTLGVMVYIYLCILNSCNFL